MQKYSTVLASRGKRPLDRHSLKLQKRNKDAGKIRPK
jgi:hypothetical protein